MEVVMAMQKMETLFVGKKIYSTLRPKGIEVFDRTKGSTTPISEMVDQVAGL